MKNQQGNNMNQLFIPADHNEESRMSYGVINNNYYYGPYTNINKLEKDTNQKISSVSSYEDVTCAKILNKNNTNNKFNSTSNVSMHLMNNDLTNIQEGLNTSKISENSTRSINLNNSSSNVFINSMDYTNYNLPKPQHLLNNFPEKRDITNYNKEPNAHPGYNFLGATSSNLNTSLQKGKIIKYNFPLDLDNTIISSKSFENSTNILPCYNSSSPNTSSLFNVFNNLQNKESSVMKQNMYNYFYYKLFDFNGEDLSHLNSHSSYQNVSKVKLFKEDEGEKIKYEVMNDIDIQSVNSIDTEDSSCIRFENPKENCFGPQKNKISTKERNFKPY